MMRKCMIIMALLVPVVLLPTFSWGGNSILVSLKSPECPWADSHLDEKVDLLLTSMNRVPIRRQSLPDTPDILSFEEIIRWGQEQGGRYLVDVTVERIDLERRKVTIVPWIMFRYRVYAVLEGTLRIFDIKKGRLIDLKNIECELKAKDKWQIVDDDKTDADLMVAADARQILFDDLEETAAAWLYEEIKKLTRGNHFDG